MKGFFKDGKLVAIARTRGEYEAACDNLCCGFKEDNATVRDISADEARDAGIDPDQQFYS